jgi:hypothetical protein
MRFKFSFPATELILLFSFVAMIYIS